MDAQFNSNGDDPRKAIALRLLWLLILIMALICLIGCKTVYVDRPVTHTEYVYKDRVDSAFIHDSVYIKEMVKGDTVRIVEYRYKDRFQYKYTTDTIIVRDTLSIPHPVEVVKVDHSLLKWQKALIWWGVICTLALLLFIYIRVRFPKARSNFS